MEAVEDIRGLEQIEQIRLGAHIRHAWPTARVELHRYTEAEEDTRYVEHIEYICLGAQIGHV